MTVNSHINATALCSTARSVKKGETKPTETPKETAPVRGDGFDRNAIPADDDGPQDGGSEPVQDPAEADGPGAGGGYNSHDIPADDDGPGAGGGYEPWQDPTESDGPGAGGGYFQGSNFQGPLTSFVTSTENMKWNSLLTEFPLSWSGTALFLEAHCAKKIAAQPNKES